MKIVLIQPKSFHCWEALNVGYLVAYLKRAGYCDVHFYSGFYDSEENILAGCTDADIIGFSCTSPQMKHALHLAKKIKTANNYIVFGGVHPTVLPEETLKNKMIDAVVVGEGEDALLDIVKGNRERIVRKPYIQDMDSLPFPDRQAIKQERNIMTAFADNGYRIASVAATRGCPYDCTFCASKSIWTKRMRSRSPAGILEEFSKVTREMNIDFMKFSDDTFTVNKKLTREFCELKNRNGIKTPWGCNIRVDTVDDATLGSMVESNCREVWIGVESGSPRILSDMKKSIDLDKIRWCFKRTRELGLFRRAYFLLGMPNENYEDVKMTEELIDQIQPDALGITILAPYPGSVYYDPELHKDVDWSVVDEYENNHTSTKHLTNEDLHREQERLIKKYKELAVFRQRKSAIL